MNRDDCLDYVYAFVCGSGFVPRPAFDLKMADWDARPMMVENEQIGVIVTCGTDIHVTMDRRGALMHAKRIIKECLTHGIEKHGYLTTQAPKDDAGIARFLTRLGFVRTHEEAGLQHYRIEQTKIQ